MYVRLISVFLLMYKNLNETYLPPEMERVLQCVGSGLAVKQTGFKDEDNLE